MSLDQDFVAPPADSPDRPDSPGAAAWLDAEAVRRENAGLHRRLRPRTVSEPGRSAVDGVATIDLAGNDYLGLSRRPEVVEAGVAALRAWGAGSTGSRLVTGTTALHAQLEVELAAFVGFPAALVFASGYAANLGAVTALAGRGDLVVSDERNHASLVDACRLSRADVVVVPHCDVAAFDAALAGRRWRRALVVT
nr:aminotransferase class I/II-fold pyridoxal phosphate-dependent enzyme [Micromonospora sp. DSM 115978]